MAKYNSMVVTNDGKSIYTKAIAGKTIEFTKAVVGSGKPESQEAAEALSNLVEPKLNGAIDIDTTALSGKVLITVSLSNEDLLQPLSIYELGLFCKDPDTGNEVMYAYCFAEDEADVIPAITDGDMIWKMQLAVYMTNATGNSTSQTGILSFTPVVTPSASGFVSNVTASAKYIYSGNLITAFYKITGMLANMENAESGLSGLTISLPKASAIDCGVSGRMAVTDTANSKTLVLVSGEIAKNGETVNIDYLGKQNGNFSLLMTVYYAI